MIRLFVGLELPDGIRARLAGLGGGVPGARWIPSENYHVTLRFIGEVDEGRAEDIDAILSRVRAPVFDMRIAGVGAFGRNHQVHTLWAGIADAPEIKQLHDKIDRAVMRAGLPPDRRKFMPHVTLARLHAAPVDRVEGFKAHNALFSAGPFRVDSFVLFSSLLSRNGAIYRPEAEYPLRAA